jgi:hypothetical protein
VNILGEIYNQRQVLDGVFIDASNAVIDEARAQKNSKRKDFRVVRGILIKSSNTLRVEDNDVDGIPLLSLSYDGFSPDPEPLISKNEYVFSKMRVSL